MADREMDGRASPAIHPPMTMSALRTGDDPRPMDGCTSPAIDLPIIIPRRRSREAHLPETISPAGR
jgi:hypothetical protein